MTRNREAAQACIVGNGRDYIVDNVTALLDARDAELAEVQRFRAEENEAWRVDREKLERTDDVVASLRASLEAARGALEAASRSRGITMGTGFCDDCDHAPCIASRALAALSTQPTGEPTE